MTGRLGATAYPERVSVDHAYRQHNTHIDTHTDTQPFIAPNGSLFCSKAVRLGILPLMLKDILETRFMVKRAMKRYANHPPVGGSKEETAATGATEGGNTGKAYDVRRRVLDARQLSIKLLANVTYG